MAWNDGRLYAASCRYRALSSYSPDAGAEDGNSNTPEPQRVLEGLPDAANGLCLVGNCGGVYFTTSDEATGKGVLGHWPGNAGQQAADDPDFPRGQPATRDCRGGGRVVCRLVGRGQSGEGGWIGQGQASDWLTGLVSPVGLGIEAGRLYVSAYLDRTVRAYKLSDRSARRSSRVRKRNAERLEFISSPASFPHACCVASSRSRTNRCATAYVCGLGFSELYLNGRKVDTRVMDPTHSRYDKRAMYVTFDVTGYLRTGRNAAGVILGNGRFFARRVTIPCRLDVRISEALVPTAH